MGMLQDEELMRSHLAALSKMLANDEISPIVDSVFDYTDVAQAQKYIHDRKNRGKVLLKFKP